VWASVCQDHDQRESVQARTVRRAVTGAHVTGVFGKEHVPMPVVEVFHAPVATVVS